MSAKDDSVVVVRGASLSSSAGLSSPPRSSPEGDDPPNAQLASEISSHHDSSITVNHSGVEFPSSEKAAVAQPPTRKKSGRKPKLAAANADSSATNTDAPRKRAPRKPKDPNAPPAQRRRKAAPAAPAAIAPANHEIPNPAEIGAVSGTARQPKIAEAIRPNEPNNFNVPSDTTLASQKGKSEDIPKPAPASFFTVPPPPPTQQQMQQPPVRTSGQNYDPIRSNYDPVRETVISHPYNNQGSPAPPHAMNRASASPSISSIVDPPNQVTSPHSIAQQSFFNQQHQQARLQRDEGPISMPPSPTANRFPPPVAVESTFMQISPTQVPTQIAPKKQDIAAPLHGPSTSKKHSMTNGSTATSSATASPKPSKGKDKELFPAPPPLPGSGLMQLGSGPNDGTEFRAPTVVLNIPMAGDTNKYVNFTRLAEERYGWDALHPRLAAQRDRLARVAAAGAALERTGSGKESGDEMSLDSEAEGSNVEMGGMSDGRTGTDGGAKKVPRKRKMKEDEYDKDDGFVDDSELLWEEQAAAANDGFFVYSGPLVPEGEKPVLDRADGTAKRGRGRGSRGGATRAATRGGGGPGSRGGVVSGPGSRGGSTTRKPRITKADRARLEAEKLEREKLGSSMALMPNNYGGIQLASAATMGNTPMVFN